VVAERSAVRHKWSKIELLVRSQLRPPLSYSTPETQLPHGPEIERFTDGQ
jgi:hypothetical protein